MNTGAQTCGYTALQDCTGLVYIEGAAVAEHVDPFGMTFASLKHLARRWYRAEQHVRPKMWFP
jgi:hypothetical protein